MIKGHLDLSTIEGENNFKTLIARVFRSELQSKLDELRSIGIEFISRAEVAGLFGVTTKTIEEWTKKGIIKSYGFPGSRRVFYKKIEIEEQLIQINAGKE